MVNVLETLYALTVIAFIAGSVQLARGRRVSGYRLVWVGALGAGLSVLLYWLLRPST